MINVSKCLLVLSASGKYTWANSSAVNENINSSDLLLLLPLVTVLWIVWPQELHCCGHASGNTKERSLSVHNKSILGKGPSLLPIKKKK